MFDRKVVIFETSDVDAEVALIREYIVPAFHRLECRGDVRWLMFGRYGHDPSVDGGEVTFYIFGDTEAVAADERERWDELVTDGFVEEWWTDDTEVRIDELDAETRFFRRMWATASRMAVEFDEEFGVGWWLGLHHLINDLGYQANDGEEEIDLLFENIRNRLFVLSVAVGPDHAEDKVNELIERLESLPPELRAYREEHGEHQHTYADRAAFEEE